MLVLSFQVERENDKQLMRTFLYSKKISQAALTEIKYHGGKILQNGKEVNVLSILAEGDMVEVHFPDEQPSFQSEPIPIEIIYEDEAILVLNKQPHINTIPSRQSPAESMANGILHYYESIHHRATVHFVNRLDQDTSGVMTVAKHRHYHHLMTLLQKTGEMKRMYLALVEGLFPWDSIEVDAPIDRKETSIIERTVVQNGQSAISRFECIERNSSFSLVACFPKTGRTHQLRVHLSYLGFPILGDTLYGGTKTFIQRHALHAYTQEFHHPIHQKVVQFTAPVPEDMAKLISTSSFQKVNNYVQLSNNN